MQRLHSGPVHPESAGTAVAHRVSQVFRLRIAPGRQVFRASRQHVLQAGFLQVITTNTTKTAAAAAVFLPNKPLGNSHTHKSKIFT